MLLHVVIASIPVQNQFRSAQRYPLIYEMSNLTAYTLNIENRCSPEVPAVGWLPPSFRVKDRVT